MDIIPFKKIKGSGYSFGKIWDTYDEQFRILRDAYLTLNDSFVVEEFTDTIDKTKRLKNSYTPGQVFVYINNVIQWKDVDYEETDGNTITLLKDIVNTDKVRIITIHVNQLRNTDNSLINYSNLISSLSTTIDSLTNRVQQLESEVSDIKSKIQ